MANTPNFSLYKPNRADNNVEVDTSLADNFTKIDTELQNNKGGLAAHISNPNAHTSENVSHADGSVKSTLENHEQRLTSLSTTDTDLVLPALSDHGTQLADHETRVSSLETSTDDIDARVTDIEVLGIDKLAPNLEGRISTLESDIEGHLAPATFEALSQQNYTFDDLKMGYVDNKLAPITSSLAEKSKKGLDTPINVKDFKCADGQYVQGDYSHDDTTGIQAALDYVSANNGILYFPPGIYKTTQKLTLAKAIVMTGDYERGDTGNGASKAAGAMIKYTGTDTLLEINQANGFQIRSLRFGCSGQASRGISILTTTESNLLDVQFNGAFATALYAESMTIGSIERCKFAANGIGIHFNTTTSSGFINDLNIVGCNFWQSSVAHVKTNTLYNVNFIGNHFEWAPKALWLVNDGFGGGVFRNVNIKHNDIFSTNATLYPDPRCIKFESTVAAKLFKITGFAFENNVVNMDQSLYPIEFIQAGNTNGSSSVSGVSFKDNLLWGGSTSAIYSDWSAFAFKLSGNDCRSSFAGSTVSEISGIYKLSGIDSTWDYNQVKGTLRLGNSGSSAPVKGDMYYGTTDDKVKVYTPTGTKSLMYDDGLYATKITTTLPTADATQRGRIVYLAVSGVADVAYICLYNGSGSYFWKQINVT